VEVSLLHDPTSLDSFKKRISKEDKDGVILIGKLYIHMFSAASAKSFQFRDTILYIEHNYIIYNRFKRLTKLF